MEKEQETQREMKWPKSITFVRHAQSQYNQLKEVKTASRLYQQFRADFERDRTALNTIRLAREVQGRFSLGVSDRLTPLTLDGINQARLTGEILAQTIPLPDVIVVSPYLRTRSTLNLLLQSWPALKGVQLYHEERIRELDHGLALIYNDWRVFHTLQPDQATLFELLGPYDYRYPNGECVPDVRQRVWSWTDTLIREFAGKNVLVVTHHITILAVRAQFERLSPEEYKRLDDEEKPVNCGVTIYEGDPNKGSPGKGKLVLKSYNQAFY